MGRPPMCLCIIRHGNRLDAADKRWHLSSPTPYDPPLTYGGWLQSRALGIRIGDVLRQEIEEREKADASSNLSSPQKRRRYQVVIHSSPFVRCIQTSIAISSGLAQNPLPVSYYPCAGQNPSSGPENMQPQSGDHHPVRPRILTSLTNQPARPPIPSFQKSVLRLDACFGEWLSPEYFETITSPPSSVLMLGSAKAELLRREEYQNYPHFHAHASSSSTAGYLWNSPSTSAQNSATSPLTDLSPLDAALPSDEVVATPNTSLRKSVSFVQSDKLEPAAYMPPILGYSTSNNGQIPQGLVSHARDECLDFDYQWDSMSGPANWGDGGLFGEEWTGMHKRFRKGLQSLVDWYATAENPSQMVTKTVRISTDNSECAVEDDEEECETIVVIVSHGAGCNALIGAITRKPVLMDVGMASLTLAVRQETPSDSVSKASVDEGGDGTVTLSETYNIKMFASTDHVRSSASTTPNQSRSPSMANVLNGQRGRFAPSSFSSSVGNFSYLDSQYGSRSSSANAALISYQRNGSQSASIPRTPSISNGPGNGGITIGSGVTSFAHTTSMTSMTSTTPSGLSRSPSVGLWSPFRSSREDDINDGDGDGLMLNFGHEKSSSSPQAKEKEKSRPSPLSNIATHTDEENMEEETNSEAATSSSEPDVTSTSQVPVHRELMLGPGIGGLWGNGLLCPSPPDENERTQVMGGQKRRWTVTERAT